MTNSVQDSFNHFLLGSNKAGSNNLSPPSAKKFTKAISVENAISAVIGNFFTKFIARLKLFITKYEWFNEKNLMRRINSHNLKDLNKLANLFKNAYPSLTKENKKISHFVENFVKPARDKKAYEKFTKDLNDDAVKKQLENVYAEYLLKCLKKNITAHDLVLEEGGIGPLINAKSPEEIDTLINDYLGPDLRRDLEHFTHDPDLCQALYLNMPHRNHQLIQELVHDGITAEMIFEAETDLPMKTTAKSMLGFIAQNSENCFCENVKIFLDENYSPFASNFAEGKGEEEKEEIVAALIGLLKTGRDAPARLLIPLLATQKKSAKKLTGYPSPTFKQILSQLKNLGTQKEIIQQALLGKLFFKEQREKYKASIDTFFARSFNSYSYQDQDLARLLPLFNNFDDYTASLIERFVQRGSKEDPYDFEKIKGSLAGISIIEKIQQILAE
ncbi:hypothetical protein [Parachlamydia sp. AcF125]|uniref:hypothetical protein n=1 Tax=Parachlamydia sp. AcF125 TaxID=2795736 RepID=UPI001BC95425|nr:hypothetical protein [Parachlamydia sp. AcF125]MBS4169020.1 hypothetical protein [Parachlamydia sp. AcF125]